MLDRALYSYGDVDRLVGLHAGTARRWLEGYERGGRFYDPVLRPEPCGSDAVPLAFRLPDRSLPMPRPLTTPRSASNFRHR